MFMKIVRLIYMIPMITQMTASAQSNASLGVDVEIIAPSLTLSVSSARINFGEIPQNAGAVELHPESGARSGEAYGTYSVAGILLTGTPGMPITVHVSTPVFASKSDAKPSFQHSWAHSQDCTQTHHTRLPSTPVLQAEIGNSGCTHIQLGGTLSVNQAVLGRYSGEMTVQVIQL